MKKIVIIGGGITGLSVAYYLKDKADFLLIEKNHRLGGNIYTEKIGDFIIEGGPDCFLSEKPWALELCEKLGLKERLLATNETNNSTFVLWRGRLHPLPEGFFLMVPTKIIPFMRSSLISLPGKIRMGMDLFIPKNKTDDDESLAGFVCRRLGREALDKIAEPLVAGIHAGDPETMSLKSSFPRFLELEQRYGSLISGMLERRKIAQQMVRKDGQRLTMFMTLKGGLSELITALEGQIKKDSIITGRSVANVERYEQGSAYRIHMADGEIIDAEKIILTTPAYISAHLLSGIDPVLSDLLMKVPYVSTATVSLAYKRSDISNPLKGYGFVVPKIENRKIMAATWTSLKFSYRAPEDYFLTRCFIGGSKNEELVSLDDKAMTEMVQQELRDVMGIKKDPALVRIYRWEKAMPQYTIGHEGRVSLIEERAGRYRGLFLTGSAYKGIGISDCIYNAQKMAEKVLGHL